DLARKVFSAWNSPSRRLGRPSARGAPAGARTRFGLDVPRGSRAPTSSAPGCWWSLRLDDVHGARPTGAGPPDPVSTERPPSARNRAGFHGRLPSFDGSLPTFDGSLPTFDGSLATSDGRLPSSDGRLPTFDGSLATFDGSLATFDGGLATFDGS